MTKFNDLVLERAKQTYSNLDKFYPAMQEQILINMEWKLIREWATKHRDYVIERIEAADIPETCLRRNLTDVRM